MKRRGGADLAPILVKSNSNIVEFTTVRYPSFPTLALKATVEISPWERRVTRNANDGQPWIEMR